MLMLSHCVPARQGDTDRLRAWQLLNLACRSHRVHLVCVYDGPTHLAQWRDLYIRAERLVLAQHHLGYRVISKVMAWFCRSPRMGFDVRGVLDKALQRWPRGQSFDAALCTRPILVAQASCISSNLCFCDLSPIGAGEMVGSHQVPVGSRNYLIVDNPKDKQTVVRAGGQALLIPRSTDVGSSPLVPSLDPLIVARTIAVPPHAPTINDPALARAA